MSNMQEIIDLYAKDFDETRKPRTWPKLTPETTPDMPTIQQKLLKNTVGLCLLAYDRITARMLRDVALAAWREYEHTPETPLDIQNFYFKTYNAAHWNEFDKRSQLETSMDIKTLEFFMENYHANMNRLVPQSCIFQVGSRFFNDIYIQLPRELREQADNIFSDFLLALVGTPDFAKYCKDKSLDVSGMGVEERMDLELDVNILRIS